MFEMVCAKSWMVKHIRDLFRARPDDLRRTTWACVVRNGDVIVMKRFLTETNDHKVMWCLLGPGETPSWFRTNWAIRKHWSVLGPIALEERRKSCAERERPSFRKLRYGT